MCRNADLNLIWVAAATNRLIFQIIYSLLEPMGVRLTWRDFNFELYLVACFISFPTEYFVLSNLSGSGLSAEYTLS